MHCWLKAEISANCSWVRRFFSLRRLTFLATNLRISMHRGQPITYLEFINYSMYSPIGEGPISPEPQ
jgi:hypothetical protein